MRKAKPKPESLFIDTTEKKTWKAKKDIIKPGHFDAGRYKCWMTGNGAGDNKRQVEPRRNAANAVRVD